MAGGGDSTRIGLGIVTYFALARARRGLSKTIDMAFRSSYPTNPFRGSRITDVS
jgi:hypothetical protein